MIQKTRLFALLLFCCTMSSQGFSQEKFTACTAAFLDNKMIVDEYSPDGKCIISAAATGKLTVCTAELSPERSIAVDQIYFKIAVRDQNTKTLYMYSDKKYKQVDIREVLAHCKKGDHIVLITLDDDYAVPHNEILVE